MSRNKKKANNKSIPTPIKQARNIENPDNFKDKIICWHFKTIDIDDKSHWNWNDVLQFNKNKKLFNRICSFETMKLSEVQIGINHSIPTNDLNKLAQDELERRNLNDFDRVHSFHVDATTRIYCLPKGNIMSLLWFDPFHSYVDRKKAVKKKI